jgi:hypothetical protein
MGAVGGGENAGRFRFGAKKQTFPLKTSSIRYHIFIYETQNLYRFRLRTVRGPCHANGLSR